MYNVIIMVYGSPDARCLGVDVHLGRAGAMPGREEHAAAAALVLDVLERVHRVGNAAQADEAAETKSPGAVHCQSCFRTCAIDR
jgi:hypothetical protein